MGTLFESKVAIGPDYMRKKKAAEKKAGRKMSNEEFEENFLTSGTGSRLSDTGTSIFDPVLCETQYLWFTKKNDKIIDPFAGGSVRGIVAVELGRHYFGVDLRQEQIDANNQNAEICESERPLWFCGDSLHIKEIVGGEYDFIFTCPPYGNLEVYSEKENDISNMSDADFDKTYCEIMRNTADMLKEDRFACVVVGNYRDKKGFLRDLVGLTVRSMEDAGLRYYNDFVFVTPNGSLPMRVGKQFQATRKMGRTHQYCLCFVKGDPKKATERLGDVELPDMNGYVTEEEYEVTK